MRPAGEIRTALLAAAQKLYTPERAPTLAEMASFAHVGLGAARYTVDNLKRCGALEIARERRVEYRNRPVCEYQLARLVDDEPGKGYVDLAQVFSTWSAA